MENVKEVTESTIAPAIVRVSSHKDLNFGEKVMYVREGNNGIEIGVSTVVSLSEESAALSSNHRVGYKNIYKYSEEDKHALYLVADKAIKNFLQLNTPK